MGSGTGWWIVVLRREVGLMVRLWSIGSVLGSILCTISIFAPASATIAQERAQVESGETQVLARIGRREITISELRVEMARLGLADGTPETQRLALQSILNRHLLVDAARDAGFHRKPEAVLRMKAAEDQAMADFFLASASQAAEPTLAEIEDYITANPALFAKRTLYQFDVLSMPAKNFNEGELTSLFSETNDFSILKKFLDQKTIPYSESPLIQPSSSFPREIRHQLAQYTVNDNIVIKSDTEAQIMKIRSATLSPVPFDDWRAIARRLVLEQNAINRARSLLDSLKLGQSVIYYRPELAPPAATKTPAGTKPKSTGK